jgi:hypothetical protein
MTQSPHRETQCRLCGAKAVYRFSNLILRKYDVGYFECEGCRSLQTEPPFWLDEAYSTKPDGEGGGNLNGLDTGAAQRNLRNLAAVSVLARSRGFSNILDFGGGDGLLCRLLRDHGMNAYVSDEHALPAYAQGFTEPDFKQPDLVTAFEVLEHLPEPHQDVKRILGLGAPIVLATTEIYEGQGPDWWYLIPQTGHHVFFYSLEALKLLGASHGYRLELPGGYRLFIKDNSLTHNQVRLLYRTMRPTPLRWYQAMLSLRPTPGVDRDFSSLSARI